MKRMDFASAEKEAVNGKNCELASFPNIISSNTRCGASVYLKRGPKAIKYVLQTAVCVIDRFARWMKRKTTQQISSQDKEDSPGRPE